VQKGTECNKTNQVIAGRLSGDTG